MVKPILQFLLPDLAFETLPQAMESTYDDQYDTIRAR